MKPDEQMLQTARQKNLDRLEALHKEGFALDPLTMLKIRLDVITNQLLGDDEQAAYDLEMAYEAVISVLFDNVEENINRQKLTAGLGHQQLSIGDLKL